MRRKTNRLGPVLLVVALASCSVEPTPAQQAEMNANARAEVEANQFPPPVALVPQPILYRDIEEHELFGAGCDFAPGDRGLGVIILAQPDRAYLKRDGEIETFAADKGSAPQPLGSWRKYDSRDYGLELAIAQDSGKQTGSETVDFPARLTIRDGKDRVIYQAEGIAQCGA